MSEQPPFPGNADSVNSPGTKTVGQVMKPTVTIEPGAHLAAADYLIKHFHDEAVVVTAEDSEEPVAAISDIDLIRAHADGRDPESTRIDQLVAASHLTVNAETSVEDAARLMLSQGVDCLPVVEGQRLIGVVELADVSGSLALEL